jgi:hypothetical protein
MAMAMHIIVWFHSHGRSIINRKFERYWGTGFYPSLNPQSKSVLVIKEFEGDPFSLE